MRFQTASSIYRLASVSSRDARALEVRFYITNFVTTCILFGLRAVTTASPKNGCKITIFNSINKILLILPLIYMIFVTHKQKKRWMPHRERKRPRLRYDSAAHRTAGSASVLACGMSPCSTSHLRERKRPRLRWSLKTLIVIEGYSLITNANRFHMIRAAGGDACAPSMQQK